MRKALNAIVALLPWVLKRPMLERFWGYDLAADAHIGFSYVFPRHLVLGSGAKIGHLNVAIHLETMVCGPHSSIGRGNWITGHPAGSKHFAHQLSRESSFRLGAHSSVVKSHIIDCTDAVSIGDFTTIAGYRSQILTHGIDVLTNRQDCAPVTIGSYSLVGTSVIVTGGCKLPSRCVLAAGAVVARGLTDEGWLYGGVPAKPIRELASESGYFARVVGRVD